MGRLYVFQRASSSASRRRLPQPQQRTFSDPLAIIPRLMEFRLGGHHRERGSPMKNRGPLYQQAACVGEGDGNQTRVCAGTSSSGHSVRGRVVIWCWMTVPRGRKERRLLWRGTSIPRAKRRQNLLWMC